MCGRNKSNCIISGAEDGSPLVSIVVPIHNVERYLSQCIESIVNQTYKNIEIILIDDGSLDRSGNIADEYARKDTRIKVFHTENKGVSAARNFGIEQAKGEYISFVDADDYLAPDFTEYLLGLIRMTSSVFSLSRNCFTFPGATNQVESDEVVSIAPMDAAFELLFPGRIVIGCWNKMFNREFLVKHRLSFSESFRMGEGLSFILNAAQVSRCVAVGNKKVYFYRKDNSLSATTVKSVDRHLNALAALDYIEQSMILRSRNLMNALACHRCLSRLQLLFIIIEKDSLEQHRDLYRRNLSAVRRGSITLFFSKVSFFNKAKVLITCISPRLAYGLTSILRRRGGVNNKSEC